MLMGIPDPFVWGSYILCILTALLCVAWGVVKWNVDVSATNEPREETLQWAKEEEELEEKL